MFLFRNYFKYIWQHYRNAPSANLKKCDYSYVATTDNYYFSIAKHEYPFIVPVSMASAFVSSEGVVATAPSWGSLFSFLPLSVRVLALGAEGVTSSA